MKGLCPENSISKANLVTFCTALSDQDVLEFLNESLFVDPVPYWPHLRKAENLSSSGLVGSLSAGSARVIEAQIAIPYWESTHQTSRGRNPLFDDDQVLDLSRGLYPPLAISPKTPHVFGAEIECIPPWANLATSLQLNYDLGDTSQRQEPKESISFTCPPITAPPAIDSYTTDYDTENCVPKPIDPFFDLSSDLYSNDILSWSETLLTSRNLNDAGIEDSSIDPFGDPNCWLGSFDDFLNTLASQGTSESNSPELNLPSSLQSSPETASTIAAMDSRLVSRKERKTQLPASAKM